jgi:predicted GNAT family acetyltransferase
MAFMDLLLTETGKVVIKHTEVDPSLGGQGIGKSLLEAVAEFCRSNEYRILAVCPFAKNLMYRYPDQYKDLI